ncbi:MAG: hypothetical protein ABI409_15970, partial [Ramlibacter sp.]
ILVLIILWSLVQVQHALPITTLKPSGRPIGWLFSLARLMLRCGMQPRHLSAGKGWNTLS